jgi:hypothetical protein
VIKVLVGIRSCGDDDDDGVFFSVKFNLL